nr:MAG TPA: hypothetical protein [Caudoviricetes sp.]
MLVNQWFLMFVVATGFEPTTLCPLGSRIIFTTH